MTRTALKLLPLLFAVTVAELRRVDPAPAITQCVSDFLGRSSPPFEWSPTQVGEGMQCLAAGLLALNDKVEILERPVWGSVSQYMTCTCPLTWRDLHRNFTFFEATSRTGGLGKLMVEDKYENWWCTNEHMCAPSGDFMCFVWGEVERRFIPWGLNSELKLVRKGPFGAVDAPSSRLLVQVAALKQEVTERLIALESGGQECCNEVTERLMALESGGQECCNEVTERLIALESGGTGGQGGGWGGGGNGAFMWRAAGFSGPCSSTCGTGTRRRTVECVLDGGVVTSVLCDASSRPAELETCNDHSLCTYYWLALPWGACSNTCGTGTRQREVHCVRTDAAKTLVDSNLWYKILVFAFRR
jgi:hypothetical protein